MIDKIEFKFMKYHIFIPVRLKSKRLPKKALKKIDGKPIIQYLIERLHQLKKINDIIICTTTEDSDNELIDFLEKNHFSYFRGSTEDILDRFLHAAMKFNSDFIIAIDGDDIYCDPDLITKIIDEFENSNADCIKIENVPVGFTSFGFKTSTLEKICQLKKTSNTETGYLRFFDNDKLFVIKKIMVKLKTSFPQNLRMSLDYDEDFKIAEIIFKKMGNNFHIEDVLKFLSNNPSIINELDALQTKWDKHWDENLADCSMDDTNS